MRLFVNEKFNLIHPEGEDGSFKIMRLQVFLSHNGVCSRREAMGVIQNGRVTLNGVVVNEPSTPVDPRKDKVTVDGRAIEAKNLDYIMLNKPAGFVTTKEDAHAERTVMDLLPKDLQHLVPVGRLDKDTEGLLLLTNDGDLTFRLTHPQFYVDKTYLVRIGGSLLSEKRLRLEKGVVIEGKRTSPAKISDIHTKGDQTEFLMVIHEGRKRQIRLMLKSVGCWACYLKRIAQGGLELGNLSLGQWRVLTPAEIEILKRPSSKQTVPMKEERTVKQEARKFTKKSQNPSAQRSDSRKPGQRRDSKFSARDNAQQIRETQRPKRGFKR